MFDKRTDFEEVKGAETVVGTSVKLKGNLKSDGNITVNGSVSGEIRTKSDVIIGGSAEIKANVVAKNCSIAGIVQGNIKVGDELRITETGKVYGDVEAKVLNIASGAIFCGRSMMADKHAHQEENSQELELLEEEEAALKLEA